MFKLIISDLGGKSMSKFKVGDRVKIVRNTCRHGFKDGEIIEVSEVDTLDERYRAVGFDGSKWWIKNEDAELVDDVVQTIAIRQKGLKVIAVLTDADGNYIKSAKAKCSPEDTFDFEIGKKLAVNRLLGEDVKNITPTLDGKELGETVKKLGEALSKTGARMASSFDWESFKSGKFAVHCDTEEKAKAFLRECDAQGIKWGDGDSLLTENKWKYYKAETLYGFDGEYGLCYGTSWGFNNMPTIDYTPSKHAIKEVKRPAKVGEWIKVVDGSGHDNGTGIFKVTSLNRNNDLPDWVYVNSKSSGIIRGDQYVVLENYQPEQSSLESKANYTTEIQIGDTVKVVNNSRVCSTYGRFIEKYVKEFYPKYLEGYEPQIGDVGVVVGKGKHETYSKDYYAVLSKDKVFCISGEGIKKVHSELVN
jgi:hypothetical protein